MNDIPSSIKRFIEEHIDLIETNKFQDLYIYIYVSRDLTYSDYPIVTEVLLDSGISVMEHLLFIPANFMRGITGITRVVIPENIKSIHDDAFRNMEINSIQIPKSVTKIGDYVFAGCYNLNTIAYEGTVANWKHIQRKHSWRYGSAIHSIHCADGLIELPSLNK